MIVSNWNEQLLLVQNFRIKVIVLVTEFEMYENNFNLNLSTRMQNLLIEYKIIFPPGKDFSFQQYLR